MSDTPEVDALFATYESEKWTEADLIAELEPLARKLERSARLKLAELEAREKRLREAAQYALDHVLELREAWSRGCISEHDGNGGTRSNRNVETEQRLRAALKETP